MLLPNTPSLSCLAKLVPTSPCALPTYWDQYFIKSNVILMSSLRLVVYIYSNVGYTCKNIRCSDVTKPRVKPYKFSNQKLKDLGMEFTPVKQCLYETVKSLQEKGHLPIPTQKDEIIRIQT